MRRRCRRFKHIGKVFHEFDSDSAAMIVLEGDKPLGADAHQFYDTLIQKLSQDTKHVEHIHDFWGDPLTAAGSQSTDGKAAYVQVFLAGNQGEALSIESVDTVRDIVDHTPAPPGVKAYVTGAAPLVADQFEVGSKGTAKVTLVTVVVIAVMLLFVYRSLVTTDSGACHGPRLSWPRPAESSPFWQTPGSSGSRRTRLICSRCWSSPPEQTTRYLFSAVITRRVSVGQDRESAFYTMYRGTAHVVLGSGLTVAGAVFCLSLYPDCRIFRAWAFRQH